MRLVLFTVLCFWLWSAFAQVVSNSAARDPAQVRAYRKLVSCPAGQDAGSHVRCRGYVVDHIKPLCFGGKDAPENMTYQTHAESLKKDEFEREACALARKCLGK